MANAIETDQKVDSFRRESPGEIGIGSAIVAVTEKSSPSRIVVIVSKPWSRAIAEGGFFPDPDKDDDWSKVDRESSGTETRADTPADPDDDTLRRKP